MLVTNVFNLFIFFYPYVCKQFIADFTLLNKKREQKHWNIKNISVYFIFCNLTIKHKSK